MALRSRDKYAPLQLFGRVHRQHWAMANMNMIIHDMEGQIEIGDTFKNPKFREGGRLRTFDRVVANPMWNQDWFTEKDYDADELGRFPEGAGFPGKQSADWGWVQHILASLNETGRAAVVLDTGAPSRAAQCQQEQGKRSASMVRGAGPRRGVIYLRKPLLQYQRTGHSPLLNKAKPEARKNKLFLINASLVFAKGDPRTTFPMRA